MKLKEWIEKENKTIREVAADLGVCEMNIYRYIAGENIPTKDNMQNIIAYTNNEVQPNDFYEVQND